MRRAFCLLSCWKRDSVFSTTIPQGVLDGDLNEFMKRYLMQEGSGGATAPIEDID